MAEARALARPSARDYEAIYILRPDIDPDGASKVANRVSEVLARENAKLVKVETWGRRKLAYPVRKYRRGVYVYLRFYGETNLVAEFERNLRMQSDAVLKFMTIKLSDEIPAEVVVNPDDVAFAAIELISEDELEESREKVLGLIESHDHRPMREDRYHGGMSDDDDDDDGGDSDRDEED